MLARAPQVVLVDELAHTNAPGSRHAKRWQDVDDLLDAGITVLTTVNIQHLESLNDVIERITGVRQQETVPGRGGAPRPAGRARRHHPGGAAPPDGPRQRLRPGEGRRGDGQLLPAAQPHRAAGDGAALAGRPGRGRLAALPHRPAGHRHLGDPRAGRRRPHRGTGERDGAAPRRPHRRTLRAPRSCSPCTCCAATAWPAPRSGRWPGCAGSPRTSARSFHTVVADDVPDGPARLRPRGRRDPARHRHLPAVPSRPGSLVESIGGRVVQDSGHIDVHMVTHAEAGRGIRLPRRFSAVPARPPGRRVGAGPAAAADRRRDRHPRPRTARAVHRRRAVLPRHRDQPRSSAGSARPCSPPSPAPCCSTSSSPRRSTPSPSPSGRT